MLIDFLENCVREFLGSFSNGIHAANLVIENGIIALKLKTMKTKKIVIADVASKNSYLTKKLFMEYLICSQNNYENIPFSSPLF